MLTYNAIFHAEAQLKFRIWSPDNCHGDGRTVDDAEPHILLAFLILRGGKRVKQQEGRIDPRLEQ